MSFVGDLLGGQAARQAAERNAQLLERDAKLKEQEGDQAWKVYEQFDLPRFNDSAEAATGAARASTAARGVDVGSGSAYEIVLENEINMERDRTMMKFNAQNAKDRKYNEATNARAEAAIQRYKGQVAQTASYFNAASSMLGNYNSWQKAKG